MDALRMTETTPSEDCKTYKVRWLILGIFVLYSASNSMQWVQYSIIADVITRFYGVSNIAVDWTSQIYMLLYIPLVFPGSMMLDKIGLRKTVIIGTLGTTIGTWVKIASVNQDLFWVTFLGQSIVAASQVCILSIPARLAATWFGPTQVSSACSIGVFGNQLGCALGFLIPPWIVTGGSIDDIKSQLYFLFIGTGVYTSIVTLLIVVLFSDKPKTPPSRAEALKSLNTKYELDSNFLRSLKSLALNRDYILLIIAYGINVGIFYAISTLLNQIILSYYPDNAIDAGQIGVVIILAGMVGSVVCGVVLDKTRKYKETTLAVYILSLVSMVVYTFTLNTNIAVVYVVSGLLGFFMTGLLPVGFELASELTYPEPEGTSAGLLNASAQLFGIALTSAYSVLFNQLNDLWANGVMSVALVVGSILIVLVSSDLKRQDAQQRETNKPEAPTAE